MIHVWRRASAGSCSRIGVRATARLSMRRQAMTAAATASASHSSGTLWSQRPSAWETPTRPTPMTNGPVNWTAGTPMLPPAALTPSAAPRWRSG